MINFPKNSIKFLILLGIILAVSLSYYPTLKSNFVEWDDDEYLLENETVRILDTEHILEIFGTRIYDVYTPLTILSFAVEHHFFGLNPFVFHLNNLILHILCTMLVFYLSFYLGLGLIGALISSLIFGLHPVHVESVAWVTERKDVLYAFFYLSSLIIYCRYLKSIKIDLNQMKGSMYLLLIAYLLGILSILAKPMALSLPLIFILFDWFSTRGINKKSIIEKVPFFIIIAGITWITYSANMRVPGCDFFEAMLIWPWTFVFYLRHFIFPVYFVPIYRLPENVSLGNYEYLFSFIIFFLVICLLFRLRKYFLKHPPKLKSRNITFQENLNYHWIIFALLFYFLSIFFLLRFDKVEDVNLVADRFMYLPCLGICFLSGYLVQKIFESDKIKKIYKSGFAVLLILIITWLALSTYKQSKVWNNSISLWEHHLKYFPEEEVALNNIATALSEKDEYIKAVEDYKLVLELQKEGFEINPTKETIENIKKVYFLINTYKKAIASAPHIDAYFNLGQLYNELGMIPEAVEYLKKTLELDYGFYKAHFGLGNLYRDVGDFKQAILAYNQVLKLHPEDEEVFINLVLSYNKAIKQYPENINFKKERSKVIDNYINFINSRAPRAMSFFNLGYLYGEIGDYERAISSYNMALDINPKHSVTLYNLGNLYKKLGDYNKAISFYKKVVDIDSRNADAYINMGIIYGSKGNIEESRRYYSKALDVDPKNSKAYFNLAYTYELEGKFSKAIEYYMKSIEFDPKNEEAYYNLGNIYFNLKNNKKAIFYYKKTTELKPEHVNALVNLSIVSYYEGDFKSAVKYFDDAVILGYRPSKDHAAMIEGIK